jgi:hypothetical protein
MMIYDQWAMMECPCCEGAGGDCEECDGEGEVLKDDIDNECD